MKHGEQLAPLIDRAMREAGGRTPGPHRDRGRRRPGPFTGLRVGLVTARTLGLRARDPGLRRVLARRPRGRGDRHRRRLPATSCRHRRAAQGGLPRFVRRGRRPARGPVVDKPAALATDQPSRGRGGRLYPEHFPHAAGPSDPARAGSPARWPRSAPSCRPRAALPAPPGRRRYPSPQAGLVIRAAEARRRRRRRARWSEQPRPGRLVGRAGGAGRHRRPADDPLPGGRGRRTAGRATPWPASWPTSPSCSGSPSTPTTGGRARDRAARRRRRRGPRRRAPTGCCSRSARTTTAPSRSTPRAASSRSTAAALLPRRRDRGRDAPPAARGSESRHP